MRRFLTIISLLIPLCGVAKSISFEELRALADNGRPELVDILSNQVFAEDVTLRLVTEITENIFLEGYVAGATIPTSKGENLDVPWQLGSKSVTQGNIARTGYLESLDGRYGVRLYFQHSKDAQALRLFGKAELNLKGCTLYKEGKVYVLSGLTAKNVAGLEEGSEAGMPRKVKRICELTDDDLCTYVTVPDCEFVSKNGAFMNVRESYMTKSLTNRYTGNSWMNGWQRLACDKDGDTIYIGIDGKVKDRRVGGGVPQGCGEVSGVLTATYMPRYGKVREYTLRPPSLDEIRFEWQGTPGFITIAGWDWNRPSEGMIPAEYGRGFMTTDYPCSIGRFMDMDNPSNYKEGEPGAETGTLGSVTDGALALTGRVCDWWDWEKDEGKSLIVGFSTAGIEGNVLYFAWSFAGGRLSQQTSALYPSWWQVSWSTDGVDFTAVPESLANMHSLPYSAGEYDGKSYETSAEAGIGYTEHLCELPASLFGCKKVFVKLSPARKVAASMSYLHRDNMEIYPDLTEKCYVNFGEISVRYR